MRLKVVGIVEDIGSRQAADAEATAEVFIDNRAMVRLQEQLGEAPVQTHPN